MHANIIEGVLSYFYLRCILIYFPREIGSDYDRVSTMENFLSKIRQQEIGIVTFYYQFYDIVSYIKQYMYSMKAQQITKLNTVIEDMQQSY